MQNFVRQWTKKSTGQCVRWFEKSTGQFKKPPAFVRFPVLNTTPDYYRFTQYRESSQGMCEVLDLLLTLRL